MGDTFLRVSAVNLNFRSPKLAPLTLRSIHHHRIRYPSHMRLLCLEAAAAPLGRDPSLLCLIIVILTALLMIAVITGVSASVSPGSSDGTSEAPGWCGGGRASVLGRSLREKKPGSVLLRPKGSKLQAGRAVPHCPRPAFFSWWHLLFLLPPAPTLSLCLSQTDVFSPPEPLCIFRPKLRSRADPRLDRRLGFSLSSLLSSETGC